MALLYELPRKDTHWKWGKEQSKAFKQCKTLLSNTPSKFLVWIMFILILLSLLLFIIIFILDIEFD